MKKLVVLVAATLAAVAAAPVRASAQSASFQYSSFSGSTAPGSSFTIALNITFTGGGDISTLAGLSYWMWQAAGPTGANMPFSIANRSVAGSFFTDLQSGSLQYPQPLTPINRNPDGTTNQTDLGALACVVCPPLGNGTYFVAHLTFTISPDAAPGFYTIANTTPATPGAGGRFSVITDNVGNTFPIAASAFTLQVSQVPEPSTFALLGLGVVPAVFAAYRRRRSRI